MTVTPLKSSECTIKPRRGRQVFAGSLLLLLAMGLFPAWKDVLAWIHGGALHESQSLLNALAGPVLLGLGLITLANAACGLPRLTFGPHGITYEKITRTQFANWNSLAPFELHEVSIGRFNRKIISAVAAIIGPETSADLQKTKCLRLSNSFAIDIPSIIEDLNAQRLQSLAALPPEELNPAHAKVSAQSVVVGDPTIIRPWATYSLIFILCLFYFGEIWFGLPPSRLSAAPSIQSLIALGALNHRLMINTGEYYRFFTAPFLHANFSHLLFNVIALYLAGLGLEKLVGRSWFFAFFFVGGIGGTLMSFAVNEPALTSVGASGAIMALFAALFISSFRLPQGGQRSSLQIESMRILIPSLLPLASAHDLRVDLGAHLGGVIAGGMLGYTIVKFWPQSSPVMPHRKIAATISLVGVLVIAASFMAVASHYSLYAQRFAALIPNSELPRGKSVLHDQSVDLVTRYPHDPRAHAYRAETYIFERDMLNARYEMETGLKDLDDYYFLFGEQLSNLMRALLAGIWIEQGAPVEAHKIMQPVCQKNHAFPPSDKTGQLIVRYHLCD